MNVNATLIGSILVLVTLPSAESVQAQIARQQNICPIGYSLIGDKTGDVVMAEAKK